MALFVDPDCPLSDFQAARSIGVDRVELFTGPYGATHDSLAAAKAAVEVLGATGARAAEAGLGINAGHDLTVDNLPALVTAVPGLAEVSIGHGLAAEALEHGMAGAVKRFVEALR